MGTLGTHLRNARESRGLDLREAAQQTRISHAYLQAIEKEDFSKLPGEVFVKGFLRNYAKFLGINEEEVMRLYTESKKPVAQPQLPTAAKQVPPAQKQPEPATSAEESSRDDGDGSGTERYAWIAVAIAALTAALLVILPEHPAVREEHGTLHSDATATAPLATSSTPTARPEKLYLDVIAQEDLWVLVRTDSSPLKKAVLKKGEAVTWSADERFLLSIGNVAAAKLLLNGKELTIDAPANVPVRDIVVTAAGVLAPKIEQPRPRKPKPAPKTVSPEASPEGQAAPPPPPPAEPAQ